MDDAALAAARALAAGPTYGLCERGAATITALCDEVERLRWARAKARVLASAVGNRLADLRAALEE